MLMLDWMALGDHEAFRHWTGQPRSWGPQGSGDRSGRSPWLRSSSTPTHALLHSTVVVYGPLTLVPFCRSVSTATGG
jgi:hypothetical protein